MFSIGFLDEKKSRAFSWCIYSRFCLEDKSLYTNETKYFASKCEKHDLIIDFYRLYMDYFI